MKYFNKTMAAAIIAGAMSLTSCVDNEVAPEVKQMREAQVAYLQAKANLEAAKAEQQRIQNEYNEANYAITLQTAEANLALKIAQVDRDVATAQVALHEQELKVAKAIADYEKYLNEQGLTDAAEYLKEYKDAVAELNTLASAKITAKANVAIEEAVLASINAPWIIQNEIQQQKLKSASSKLATQQAVLEVLENVAADPESYEEEALELTVKIKELATSNSKLAVEEKKAQDAVNAAAATMAAKDVENTIAEYEALEEAYKNEEDADAKAKIKAEMDEMKADYDEAVALKTDWEDKKVVLADIQAEYTANSTMSTGLNQLLVKINTYLTSIDNAIAVQQRDIETTQSAIVVIEKAIAGQSVDKEMQEAEVAKKKAALESIEAQYTAQESVVAKYKALLDAAVAN